jgi:hypothetical protein
MICKDCHNRVPDKDNFCVSGMQAEPLSKLQNHPDRSEPWISTVNTMWISRGTMFADLSAPYSVDAPSLRVRCRQTGLRR